MQLRSRLAVATELVQEFAEQEARADRPFRTLVGKQVVHRDRAAGQHRRTFPIAAGRGQPGVHREREGDVRVGFGMARPRLGKRIVGDLLRFVQVSAGDEDLGQAGAVVAATVVLVVCAEQVFLALDRVAHPCFRVGVRPLPVVQSRQVGQVHGFAQVGRRRERAIQVECLRVGRLGLLEAAFDGVDVGQVVDMPRGMAVRMRVHLVVYVDRREQEPFAFA